jgi:ferredoxin
VTPGWELRVDETACRCNAICVAVAPDLFELAGDVARVTRPLIEEADLDPAREAEALCPTQAIALVAAPATSPRAGG